MKKEDFQGLIQRYIRGEASQAEKRLLEEYYNRLATKPDLLSADEEEILRKEMLANIFEKAGIEQAPVRKIRWWRYVAAAAALIVVASGSYYAFFNKQKPEIAKTEKQPVKNDIAPGSTKAILTLSGGRKLILDSAANDTVLNEGSAIVANAKGALAYNKTTAAATEIIYNTLTTQRAGQYKLTLPDGTEVWLNSASSITYPTAFNGKERNVTITGEAYFEVAKDRTKPFHVKANDIEVEVLGTHFNINSYSDEESIKTTLLEGSVKITKQSSSILLKPGEQGILNVSGSLIKTADIDLDKIMAWKNGWFEFDETNLETIMRQVSRWYDVDISYEGKPSTDKFGGRVSKNVPLSDILKSLEANSKGIKFRLEGNKLIVQP